MQEKMTILKYKSKLRSSQYPQHICDVFMMPDFTPLDQKKNKEMSEQLADMNKFENKYVIKMGKSNGGNIRLLYC